VIPALRYRDAPAALEWLCRAFGGRGFTCRDPEGHLWTLGTYDPWVPQQPV